MWQIPIYIPSWIVPASMAGIGSVCLGLALVLVLLDMPGGVNWSKVGAWVAVIGGFGALGGAAGWLGEQILWGQQKALSFSQEWGSRLTGGGILLVIVFLVIAWTWKGLTSKGIQAGGKGKVSSRVRSLFKASVFAMAGATLATVFSPLYTLLDAGIRNLHNFLV